MVKFLRRLFGVSAVPLGVKMARILTKDSCEGIRFSLLKLFRESGRLEELCDHCPRAEIIQAGTWECPHWECPCDFVFGEPDCEYEQESRQTSVILIRAQEQLSALWGLRV